MPERFSGPGREIIDLAREEARTLEHDYIGTEHIVLGVLREDEGLAARVLESLDITVERVRAEIVRIVGSGEALSTGRMPFTPRAQRVLAQAVREALSLDHDHIGGEHILLGLVRENEGVAARILRDLGVDRHRVRAEVLRALPEAAGSAETIRAPSEATGRERAPVARRSETERGRPGSAPGPPRAAQAGRVLAGLEREIRARLGREPDNGDLLVVLASMSEGVVGRALAALGVDHAGLVEALARARAAAPDRIEAQLALARERKDEAIDDGDLEAAVAARARERELLAAQRRDLRGRLLERLGLGPG